MMAFIETALADADVILMLPMSLRDLTTRVNILKEFRNRKPVIIAVNKIDLSNQAELENIVRSWKEKLPLSEVIPVSAINNFNLNNLLDLVIKKLPEENPFSRKISLLTGMKGFRLGDNPKKVFLNYHQEIPYSVEIEIESFKDEGSILKICALIHVTRDSQKGIIIGHKGSRLKKWALKHDWIWRNSLTERYFLKRTLK